MGTAALLNASSLEIKTISARTAKAKDVVDALREAGGCIVKGLVTEEHLIQIEQDLRPYLESDQAWEGMFPRRDSLDFPISHHFDM